MYGTVMIGKMAQGVTEHDWDAAMKEWLERHVDGFVDEQVMVADDGRFVSTVRFRDREAYEALSDAPEQDAFYATRMRPLLEGDPQWIDGEWVRDYSASH